MKSVQAQVQAQAERCLMQPERAARIVGSEDATKGLSPDSGRYCARPGSRWDDWYTAAYQETAAALQADFGLEDEDHLAEDLAAVMAQEMGGDIIMAEKALKFLASLSPSRREALIVAYEP